MSKHRHRSGRKLARKLGAWALGTASLIVGHRLACWLLVGLAGWLLGHKLAGYLIGAASLLAGRKLARHG